MTFKERFTESVETQPIRIIRLVFAACLMTLLATEIDVIWGLIVIVLIIAVLIAYTLEA